MLGRTGGELQQLKPPSKGFDSAGHLPHLRRWASRRSEYPVLPHWAKVLRASGAAFRLTNQKPLTTSCQLQVASYHWQIPKGPRPGRSAGGATQNADEW